MLYESYTRLMDVGVVGRYIHGCGYLWWDILKAVGISANNPTPPSAVLPQCTSVPRSPVLYVHHFSAEFTRQVV